MAKRGASAPLAFLVVPLIEQRNKVTAVKSITNYATIVAFISVDIKYLQAKY